MTKVMIVHSRGVINTLGSLAKIFCWITSGLAENHGYEVVAVCNEFKKGTPLYPISDKVHFINLGAPSRNPIKNLQRKAQKTFRSVLAPFSYRHLIKKEQPDIIIFFDLKDAFNLLGWQRKSHLIPAIVMCHTVTFKSFAGKSRLKDKFYKAMVARCAAMQVLSQDGVAKTFANYGRTPVLIPNYVEQLSPSDTADLTKAKKKIIYLARLSADKRQHIIVNAFAKFAKDFPDWTVEFYGPHKGDYYNDLMTLIASHHLSHQIKYMGETTKVYEVNKGADIHAFPSAYEGFPLGLTESMACGLAVIGFKETSGVNELIVDGKNGFLAKDEDDFADKLKLLISDQAQRIKLGKQAREDMKAYAPDKILAKWDSLIKATLK